MIKKSWNDNWLFYKEGAEEKKEVMLPHDAMIHEKRDAACESGSAGAFFPGGKYVYEKRFSVSKDWSRKTVLLYFEGVYRNAVVFVNGEKAGERPYGYIPFTVDISPFVKAGEENVVTVKVDNSEVPNSRWYSGSGIYRPVSLIVGDAVHIKWQGVRITTLEYKPAKIKIEMQVEKAGGIVGEDGCTDKVRRGDRLDQQNDGIIRGFDQDSISMEELSKVGYKVEYQIKEQGSTGVILSGEFTKEAVEVSIPDAKLWSDFAPNLYECRVILKKDDTTVDEVTESFGIRKVEWSPEGLKVNGRNILLRGGCIHHDSGILGAATYAEAEERRVKLLSEAGFNAIRSSHNPASAAMLEACDKYGVYVMDETWDMWYHLKTKHDYANDFEKWWKQDIRDMVLADYNHPSVILYSIGNEVSEPAHEKGIALAGEMVDLLHELDETRAVTAGMNLMILSRSAGGNDIYGDEGRDDKKKGKMNGMSSTMFNMITMMVGTGMNKAANGKKADRITAPVLDKLDIAGYNYASGRYPLEGKAHPDRVIMGSETFPQDIYKNWEMVKKFPYLIGDFMWTAWDYLGEAGIGAWAYTDDGKGFDKPYPWLLGEAGALDILGNPNGELFLAQAAWGLLENPVICVQPVNHPGKKPAKSVWRGTNSIPSWSWAGCEGNPAVVEVYANADHVVLKLNDKIYGKKKIKQGKAVYKIPYQSGKLEVVSYDSEGHVTGKNKLQSATGNIGISINPEKNSVKEGEIVFVDVTLEGSNHVTDSNSDRKLDVKVEGGELLAFGSANPRTEERYDAGSFTSYYGKTLAAARAGAKGELKITVTDGKMSAEKLIKII